jgi:hypothetical protein
MPHKFWETLVERYGCWTNKRCWFAYYCLILSYFHSTFSTYTECSEHLTRPSASKFYYQLMHKRIALRVLKLTLKQLQHVSVWSPSSGSALYELAKITMLKQSIKIHWCGLIWWCGCICCQIYNTAASSHVANSAADIHQQGPDNIRSHTTRLNHTNVF